MTRHSRLRYAVGRRVQIKSPDELLKEIRADAIEILGAMLIVIALLVWA